MFQAKKYCILGIFLCFFTSLEAQNLEQFGGPLFSISGNVSIGTSFYNAINRESRRSPFAYFITASPTVSVYGFDIPISLSYRDQAGSVTNPFNRLSFNPRYKWLAINAGKFTKSLSTYTLSSQVISGAAVDLTPGRFRFSIVRGNMENAFIQIDTLLNMPEALPSYKRNAFAIKAGYGTATNFIDLIAFKAKDDINSIDQSLNDLKNNRPQENIVLGSSFGLSPVRWLSFKAELSGSAHTANQESSDILITEDTKNLRERYGSQLTINSSTKIQFAGRASIDFRFKRLGFGGEYRRVDPLYKSLGAFYFQEDYENYLVRFNFSLLEGKFRFNGRGGIQRNNLNNLRKVTNTRQILSTNVSMLASRNLTVLARYANFQTDRSPGLVAVNDSLRYARANAAYGITPRFMFGDKDKRSTISLAYNHQNLSDVIADQATENNIKNNVVNLNYNLNLESSGMNLNLSVIANRNEIKNIERERAGVHLGFSKKLSEDKMTFNLGLGGFQNYLDGTSAGYSITGRIGAKYRMEKSVNISGMINMIERSGTTAYRELRGNLRVSFRLPDVSSSRMNKSQSQIQKSKS